MWREFVVTSTSVLSLGIITDGDQHKEELGLGAGNMNNCAESRTFSVRISRCRVNSRLVTI